LSLSSRAFVIGVQVALLCCVTACGPKRAPRTEPTYGAEVGVYKARLEPTEGKIRRFRLMLFATLPDRIHGEVVSPLGSTVLIFDGGGGQLSVTFVRDRIAFVGPADGAALEAVLGLDLPLEELVRALLVGELASTRHRITRTASRDPGLPDSLEIADGRQLLQLRLKKRQPLRTSDAELGRGEPPPGMERRPLSELRLHELPIEDGGAVARE
jgi:hypothetical protein